MANITERKGINGYRKLTASITERKGSNSKKSNGGENIKLTANGKKEIKGKYPNVIETLYPGLDTDFLPFLVLLSIFICLYFCITRRCYVFIAFNSCHLLYSCQITSCYFFNFLPLCHITCHSSCCYLLYNFFLPLSTLLAAILFFSPFPLADVWSFAAILYLLSFHPPFIILAPLLALTLLSASPVIPFTVDLISTAVPLILAYSEPCQLLQSSLVFSTMFVPLSIFNITITITMLHNRVA